MTAKTKAELEFLVAELQGRLAEAERVGEGSADGPDERTVIERILDIAAEVGVLEPEKAGGVPFAFRGIDATVAKLTPLLNRHGVFFAPVDVLQSLTLREVGNKVVTKADLTVSYRAYGAKGDYLEFQVPGQADDFADRSSAQAMSVAFRILLLQVFHIAAFGNEEAASEETKNTREASGRAKVSNAHAKAERSSTPNGPEMLRTKIADVAARKGMEPEDINTFLNDFSGKSVDDWWDDAAVLSAALTELSKE